MMVRRTLLLGLLLLAARVSAVDDQAELRALRQAAKDLQKHIDSGDLNVVPLAHRVQKQARAILPANHEERINYLELAATVFLASSMTDEADDLYREAHAFRKLAWEETGDARDRSLLVRAMLHLGMTARSRGDLPAAARWQQQALDRMTPGMPDHDLLRAGILNEMGVYAALTSDLGVAYTRFSEAAEIGNRPGFAEPRLLAKANKSLGDLHLIRAQGFAFKEQRLDAKDELKHALDYYGRAGRYYTALGRKRTLEEHVAFLQLLYSFNQVKIESRDYRAAAESLERIIREDDRHMQGRLGAQFYQALGLAKWGLGRTEEAIEAYKTALRLHPVSALTPASRTEQAIYQAELARMLGVPLLPKTNAEALSLARDAVRTELAVLEDGFGYQSDRQRLQFLKSRTESLGLYFTLTRPADGLNAETAYAEALAWKGVVTARSTYARAASDPQLAAQLADRRKALLTSAEALRTWQGASLPSGLAANLKWVAEMTRRQAEVDRRERELETGMARPIPPTPRELASVLPDGTVVVDYLVSPHVVMPEKRDALFAGRQRVLAFLSRKGLPTACIELESDFKSIAAAVDAWESILKTLADGKQPPQGEQASRLNDLHRLVWKPISEHPHLKDANRIILAPDDSLWRVPFAALPGRDPKTFLVEEAVLVYAFSARQVNDLYRHRGNYSAKPGNGCLLVGAIDYGTPTKHQHLAAIIGARQWLDGIAGDYRNAHADAPKLLSGAEATARAVLPNLAGAREIQLLGHGPLVSHPQGEERFPVERVRMPLAGANANSAEHGGPNTPEWEEIAALDLRGVQRFIWWGCSVNAGSAPAGEGIVGIPRSLYIAGCQSVLASQWELDVATARRLSGYLNRQVWIEGHSLSDSLALAQRQLLKSDQKARLRPDWWGGVIVIGDSSNGK